MRYSKPYAAPFAFSSGRPGTNPQQQLYQWCVKNNCNEDFCSQYDECKSNTTIPTAVESSALTEAAVDKLTHGTVLIRVKDGEGSGFFVRDNVIMTNGHVLTGLKAGDTVTVVLDSGTRDGKQVQGIVMALSNNPDLGLVWVEGVTGRTLDFSASKLIQTSPVVAVGFPLGSMRAVDGSTPDPTVSMRPGAVTGFQNDASGNPLYVEHNTNM